MSKAELIKKLIEEGKTFQEVKDISGSVESYVKAQFTKNGKDWKADEIQQAVDSAVEEEPVVVPEGATSDPIVEPVVPEGATSAPIVPEKKKEVKKTVELSDGAKECLDLLESLEKSLPVVRRAMTQLYRTEVKQVLSSSDFSPIRIARVKARYRLIKPRPAPANINSDLYLLQENVLELFRENNQK